MERVDAVEVAYEKLLGTLSALWVQVELCENLLGTPSAMRVQASAGGDSTEDKKARQAAAEQMVMAYRAFRSTCNAASAPLDSALEQAMVTHPDVVDEASKTDARALVAKLTALSESAAAEFEAAKRQGTL